MVVRYGDVSKDYVMKFLIKILIQEKSKSNKCITFAYISVTII